jgi:hypothetical protein
MKESKRKIRRTNIRRRTKKYNYRKIQRGGMLSQGDKTTISGFMQSLSSDERVTIVFPYDNIHMDIAFPEKSLDQDINKNYQGLRNDELKPINLGDTDLDFNDIPNVPNFITNDYDISELSFTTLQIIQRNKFDRKEGILVPISNSDGEPIPRSVIYLIKTMKQLARESQGFAIYLDGEKQRAITHTAPAPTTASTAAGVAAAIDTSKPPFTETCTFFNTLLAEIKTNYNISRPTKSPAITDKNWDIYFYRIINSFTADDPYLSYFKNFSGQIMDPIEGNNDPIITYKQGARDEVKVGNDTEPLRSDDYIKLYNYKIERFLKLPKITDTGSNLLQYITNKVTIFIYTQNSKIIIQVYTVYYIIIGNIQAKGKGNWKSLLLGDKYRATNYYQFIIGCVVLIKTVDIIKGTVEYNYEIRWLLNQHTINNMVDNGMKLQSFFANNIQDILVEKDSTYGFNGPKNTHNYNDPNLPGNQNPAPTLTEEKQTLKFPLQPTQSFTDPGSGLEFGPLSNTIQSSSSSAAAGEAQGEAQWQNLPDTYEPDEGDVDVGGRKKNKTRRKLNKKKKSNKRKAKY